MAASLTCTIADGFTGPVPADNGMVAEEITIAPLGTLDGDTGTYTCQFVVPNRVIVGGNLEYSISGNVVTFKATANIDDNTLIAARILGYVV